MDWKGVGDWLKGNAGTGAALVGSILSGNIPGAIASGVALVSSATGTTDPDQALVQLQTNPEAMLRLKELAVQDADNIRKHIRDMEELRLTDLQSEHHETQETIRGGDKADDIVVRRTRPLQSWASLSAAFVFIFWHGIESELDLYVLGLLLTLPWAYAGLREIGKGITTFKTPKVA